MVKKFYMETKQGTLEQSVLDVWQNAAEQTDIKMDGRTKGYRNHRSKLEARRAKREEKKASTKKEVYELGTDEYRKYLEGLTPGETVIEEPVDPNNPLLTMGNVVATPHMAGTTWDTWARRAQFGFENMERVRNGESPQAVVRDFDS